MTLALVMAGCGTITELVESALGEEDGPVIVDEEPEDVDVEPDRSDDDNAAQSDSEIDEIESDKADDLEDLVENAEDELGEDPEQTLTTPDVSLRDVAGATESAIEHIAYVEAFWTDVAPDMGFEYEPVLTERLIPRSETMVENDLVCSTRRIEQSFDPDDVENNAYVTICDEGITMVWDDVSYEVDLEQRFPGAGMAMLIAHEWGHIIQFQVGTWFTLNPLTSEQQADCWSGAYARWAEERGIEPFTDAESLDFAIISTLETRDPVGSSPTDAYSHGNGFDRVRATQEGYDLGASFCYDYESTPPPITQSEFLSAEDRQNEGNLPYDDAFALIVPAVETYFESLSEEPLQPFVDEPSDRTLRQLHNSIGDLAIGTEYALRYAAAVQEANGDAVSGVGPALQRSCLMGSFLDDAFDNGLLDEDGLVAGSLSPGDLDEAIITLSTSDELLANPGVVFEMVAAMRVGTLEGIDACALA